MYLPYLSGQACPDTQKSILLHPGIRTGAKMNLRFKKETLNQNNSFHKTFSTFL